MFIVNCPKCGKPLQMQEDWIGMQLTCPLCQGSVTVFAPEAQTLPPEPPQTASNAASSSGAAVAVSKKLLFLIAGVVLLLIAGIIAGVIVYTAQPKSDTAQPKSDTSQDPVQSQDHIAAIRQAADAAGLVCSEDGTAIIGVKQPETITSVAIPDGITTIGKAAFANCRNLTEVNIPGSVTSIGESAFAYAGYYNGATVYYPDNGTWTEDDRQQYGQRRHREYYESSF